MNELTLMDTIVNHSKECIIMRFVKVHLSKSLFLARRLPDWCKLPSINTIKIPMEELEVRLNERENDIAKLLLPLFEGKDFNYHNSEKYSLSVNEIRDGYILLKEIARRDPVTKRPISYKQEEYTILLRSFKSPSTGFWYSPGVLYEIGRNMREEDLIGLTPSDEEIISNDLLNIIIKKKTAYEYLE